MTRQDREDRLPLAEALRQVAAGMFPAPVLEALIDRMGRPA